MPGHYKKMKKPVMKKAPGGSMKPVPKGNKGLAKLPTKVRNKMGYAKGGGKLKMVEKNGKKVPFFAADGVGKMVRGGSLKIKPGDTLSEIAKQQGTTVKAIVAANPSIKNANMIRAGQTIKIPSNTRTTNPYKAMTSKEITSGRMATRKRKPAKASAKATSPQGRPFKKTQQKPKQKKSVFGRIKKMLGMKKTGGTVRK